LDADDRLLERCGDGVGDDLGVGARVGGVHDHGGRYDLRVLADRQLEEREESRDGDERRDDPGEDGPVDEEIRQLHRFSPLVCATSARASWVSMATRCGVTCAPGRTRCRPLTTMVSPGARPSATTRRPSTIGPSLTGRYATLLSLPTTST